MRVDSKIFIFRHFLSLFLQEQNILTFQTWLKKSIINLLRSGCKISMKNTICGGQYDQMCDFGLKIVIFGPYKSPPG